MGSLLFSSLMTFAFSVAIAGPNSEMRQDLFESLIEHLVDNEEPKEARIQSYGQTYTVVVHNRRVRSFMKSKYLGEDLKKIDELLAKSTEFKINERGLVSAAERNLTGGKDPTNYDAVWLRDSLWVYLALNSSDATKADAKRVLKGMLDYVSAEAQLKRFEKIIANPKLVTSKNGGMEVVHVRFDGKSTDFQDVMVDSQPQPWNHKQNDALGLLFDLVVRALAAKELEVSDLTESNWMALSYFPAYFSRIGFYQMEDAGPWEEIEKVNSSSIGLVTSSLETLESALYPPKGKSEWGSIYFKRARSMKSIRGQKVSQYLSRESLKSLIALGYKKISQQIAGGGESPLYRKNDLKLREADAALLNLIYPARLSKLTLAQKRNILRIIQPLVGRVGVKRYLNDSYQAGNYWFLDVANQTGTDERTADTSSREGFAQRSSKFIPATEAQWFFDAWISKCYGMIGKVTKEESDRAEQVRFFNRALGQITGGGGQILGADASVVPSLAFPESYNTVALNHSQFFVPSPITPLNWAKASYLLARAELPSTP